MSIFDIIVVTLIVWWLGNYMRLKAKEEITKQIQSLDQDIEKLRKVFKRIKLEQHGDMLYVWDHDTDKFIMQGQTAQDFEDRVPHDMMFRIESGDPEAIRRFKELFPQTKSQ
jgi:hypothetical protein